METRANYVLIGACALAGIILGLGFFVWLAKLQVDRQYAYYDILFDNVSGLSRAADVRFSGLSVGQVMSIDLDRSGSGLVRVRVEVDADTPIHQGATAQLQAQGVTGTSLVAMTGGDPLKALLRDEAKGGVPIIRGQRSVVQSLTEDAPTLVSQALKLVSDLQKMAGPENQAKVTSILSNVETATGSFQSALSDFSSISKSVEAATGQISTFTDKLDPIAASVDSTLTDARTAMAAVTGTFGTAQTTLGTADTTLKSINGVATVAGTVIGTDGAAAVADLRQTTARLDSLVTSLGSEAHAVLTAYGDTATTANARLDELQATVQALDKALGSANTALASVDSAATGIDGLVRGDGTALVGDARTALASVQASANAIETAATQDLPAIMAEIRQALGTINATVDTASANITTFTGDLAPVASQASTTLDSATTTFRDASAALDRLEPVLTQAEDTLQAAQDAFGGAKQVMSDSVAPAAADLRVSAARMSDAVNSVAADLPAITAELRETLAQATATVQRIGTVVQQSGGPINEFTQQGLPQFTRFAQEGQALIARLDRIAAQFERDPARFILSPAAPTYRR